VVLPAYNPTENPYPSYYGNSEGFKWISAECDQAPSDARQHMPVIKGGFFEQGSNADLYRSVYCKHSNR